jgi:hypothetical protein
MGAKRERDKETWPCLTAPHAIIRNQMIACSRMVDRMINSHDQMIACNHSLHAINPHYQRRLPQILLVTGSRDPPASSHPPLARLSTARNLILVASSLLQQLQTLCASISASLLPLISPSEASKHSALALTARFAVANRACSLDPLLARHRRPRSPTAASSKHPSTCIWDTTVSILKSKCWRRAPLSPCRACRSRAVALPGW